MAEPGEYIKCKTRGQLWCTHQGCGYVPWSALWDACSCSEPAAIGTEPCDRCGLPQRPTPPERITDA